MELHEITAELEEIMPDEDASDVAFEMVVQKIGHLAEGRVTISAIEDPEEHSRRIDKMQRDMVAGVVLSTIQYGMEEGVDIERAVDERLGFMEEVTRQYEEADDDTFDVDTDLEPSDDKSFH